MYNYKIIIEQNDLDLKTYGREKRYIITYKSEVDIKKYMIEDEIYKMVMNIFTVLQPNAKEINDKSREIYEPYYVLENSIKDKNLITYNFQVVYESLD